MSDPQAPCMQDQSGTQRAPPPESTVYKGLATLRAASGCVTSLTLAPEGALVLMPDLTVVAEGDAPAGQRWYLKAGGSADDYYTMLETVHPDGHRDEGGMGGPVLYPRRLLNVYTGRADPGLFRVIVRADPRVRRLRFQSEFGERCEMQSVGEDVDLGVTFFAILLPWETGLVSLQALDGDGQVLLDSSVR